MLGITKSTKAVPAGSVGASKARRLGVEKETWQRIPTPKMSVPARSRTVERTATPKVRLGAFVVMRRIHVPNFAGPDDDAPRRPAQPPVPAPKREVLAAAGWRFERVVRTLVVTIARS